MAGLAQKTEMLFFSVFIFFFFGGGGGRRVDPPRSPKLEQCSKIKGGVMTLCLHIPSAPPHSVRLHRSDAIANRMRLCIRLHINTWIKDRVYIYLYT